MQIVAAERANRNADNSGYDPATYLEANLFGEEDTRSNMMRLVSQRLTKIINIPNMKDHGATGVTGCLKNIAYGSFSNVARTHQRGKSHTYSVVGTLASIEPLRSRTVLQIMDGLRGVWHGGPFARTTRYVFYPKQILFGTDPVAIDRLLLDIIDDKRKAQGAISIWDRSPGSLKMDDTRARDADPNVNIIIREPGHVEYAVVARPRRVRPGEDQGAGHRRYDGCSLLAAARVRCRASTGRRASTAGRRSRPPASSGSACRPTRPRPGEPPASPSAPSATRSSRRARRCRSRASPPAPASRRRRARPGSSRTAGASCGIRRRSTSTTVPAGKAALAAAEAFAYGADAVLKIDPADLASVGAMLTFLDSAAAADLPPVADFAVVDDGSAVTGEVMNLLARRNLLFQVGQGAVVHVSASTSRSAVRSIRRKRPPTRAPSRRRSGVS